MFGPLVTAYLICIPCHRL